MHVGCTFGLFCIVWKVKSDMKRVTQKELQKLSIYAMVAFAARCARRVQPLFDAWGDDEEVAAVERAIAIAEQYSQGSSVEAATTSNTGSAHSFAARTAAVYGAVARAAFAARAADSAYAARAAVARARAAVAGNAAASARAADNAFAAHAAVARADYDQLLEAFEGKDDAIVPHNFFGPPWPDGEPEGWQEAIDKIRKAHREFYLKLSSERDNPDASSSSELPSASGVAEPEPLFDLVVEGDVPPELVQRLVMQLSALHEITQGVPLEVVREEFQPARIAGEVSS